MCNDVVILHLRLAPQPGILHDRPAKIPFICPIFVGPNIIRNIFGYPITAEAEVRRAAEPIPVAAFGYPLLPFGCAELLAGSKLPCHRLQQSSDARLLTSGALIVAPDAVMNHCWPSQTMFLSRSARFASYRTVLIRGGVPAQPYALFELARLTAYH